MGQVETDIGKVSIRFHRGGPSHLNGTSRKRIREFQSAFIAVARLTDRTPVRGADRILVSIRFHRGGPSHFQSA